MIDGERLPRLQQQQKVHAHSMFTRIGKKFFFFLKFDLFKFYFPPSDPLRDCDAAGVSMTLCVCANVQWEVSFISFIVI